MKLTQHADGKNTVVIVSARSVVRAVALHSHKRHVTIHEPDFNFCMTLCVCLYRGQGHTYSVKQSAIH